MTSGLEPVGDIGGTCPICSNLEQAEKTAIMHSNAATEILFTLVFLGMSSAPFQQRPSRVPKPFQ